MKKLVALSAIGKDQPGIVAALAKVLFEKGCNLEDSSMTRLKGDFAVLLLISLPESLGLEELKAALQGVAQVKSLNVALRPLSGEEAAASPGKGTLAYTLVVYGVDHPGIVYRVTQAAADLGANITDLRTHVTMSGSTPLYSLAVELEMPGPSVVESFQKKLESLKKELKVEATLNPVEADEL
ncbi:MAG TPA: ACT domain-containing protein [bacterium]|nr:ACT domain-containing protein [bacterium]